MPTSRSFLILLAVTLLLFSMGHTSSLTHSHAVTPNLTISDLPVLTVFPNDSTGPETAYVIGAGHRFKVRVKVELPANGNFDSSETGVDLLWIDPSTDREKTARASLEPGTSDVYGFVLEESKPLELCIPYFYRWSIVYDLVEGARKVYLSVPHFAVPSQSLTSTGAMQQAGCLEPSSTPWGDR